MAWDDRFSGEALEPPIWGCCDYCGKSIRVGESYRQCGDDAICYRCEKRFAMELFKEQSERRIARTDDLYERQRERDGA